MSYNTLLEEDLGDNLSEDVATELHFISQTAQRMEMVVLPLREEN